MPKRQPPHFPRHSGRSSRDNPHLRLCAAAARDEHDDSPASYKFPGVGQTKPATPEKPALLVAARVNREPVERRFTGSDNACAVLNDPDVHDPDRAGRIMSSKDLVREIESTLDRMQSRLSDFRTQMDEAFKFPTVHGQDEPHGPQPPNRPRAA